MIPRRLASLCVLLVACLLPGAAGHAAAPGVGLSAQVTSYPENEQGIAMVGSRYLYIGTSTANTLYVLDFGARHAVRWHLPDLGNGIPYGMEHLVLSPDNSWLYISNYVRGDIVAVDVTGRHGMRTIAYGQMPTALAVSRDGRYLYVGGGYLGFSSVGATHVYETATGTQVGRGFAADDVASGPGGTLYGVSITRGHAAVSVYTADGGAGRLLAAWSGDPLATANGSIAVSPDGRRVYVLWDGLRALDARTGRVLGLVRLPIAPAYTGLVVAPNGTQAMLWAPDIAGWSTSPTSNPAYVRVHYGFATGGVLPVDLNRMRPLLAHLEKITTPRAVTYAADSRRAYVTELRALDWLTTGTAGRASAALPAVSLKQPVAGASGGMGGGSSTSGGSGATPAAACPSWNVSGMWQFSDMRMGDGQATLQQSGTAITGTVTQGGQTGWAVQGTIQGATVTLHFTAAGQADQTVTGEVSPDGASIAGVFSGGHARCTGVGTGGSTGGSGGAGSSATATACTAWDVSGAWTFQSMTMGDGQAALQQAGTTLSGTVTYQNGAVGYTMSGSIQGATVSLTFSEPGYATISFQGPIADDGTTIDGGSAVLSGGHARCLTH